MPLIHPYRDHELIVVSREKVSRYPDLSPLTINAVRALHASGHIGKGDKKTLDAVATKAHRQQLQALANVLGVTFVMLNSEGPKDAQDFLGEDTSQFFIQYGERFSPQFGPSLATFFVSNDSLDGTSNTAKFTAGKEGRASSLAAIGEKTIPIPDQLRGFALVYNDCGLNLPFDLAGVARDAEEARYKPTLEQAIIHFIKETYAPQLGKRPSDISLELLGNELTTSSEPNRHRRLYDLALAAGLQVSICGSCTVTPEIYAAMYPGHIYAQIAGSTETFTAAQAAANLSSSGAHVYLQVVSENGFYDVDKDGHLYKKVGPRSRHDMDNRFKFSPEEETLLRSLRLPDSGQSYFTETDIEGILAGRKIWSTTQGNLPSIAFFQSLLLSAPFSFRLSDGSQVTAKGLMNEVGVVGENILTLMVNEEGAFLRMTPAVEEH